jgi:ABC-type branched-subunit amino acid transport system substrate-binding protein
MSTSSEVTRDPFAEPEPAPGGPRLIAPVIAGVVVLAVLAVLGWQLFAPDPPPVVAGPEHCGSPPGGVIKLDGECIGVTDGTYVFRRELADEEDLIVRQNDAIGRQRSVTVAVLDPLTPDDTSALDIDEIQHQLHGAIVAQKWVNEDAATTNSVRIRLVLANEGAHQTHWQPVVEQLKNLKQGTSPLVAAVGMGVSVQQTLDAAQQLSAYDIPAIGAVTTADDLSQASGFFRVSPSNRDYVEALKPWTRRFSSALKVYDVASDDPVTPDIFTRSLSQDFDAAFKGPLKLSAVNFHGSENSTQVQPDRFGRIRDKICNEKIPLVLFAGRRNDVRLFIKALERRACASDTPVTVMVGGTDLGGLLEGRDLRRANISLVWSAGADITAWKNKQDPPDHFGRFLTAFQGVYGQENLDDGEAVVGYDALLTAASAAQSVDDDPADDTDSDNATRPLPSGNDVRGALLNTYSLGAIHGAGGELAYEKRENGRSSDPIGKLIPVLQLGVPITPPPGGVYRTK